jgi:hypothetical protein
VCFLIKHAKNNEKERSVGMKKLKVALISSKNCFCEIDENLKHSGNKFTQSYTIFLYFLKSCGEIIF